MRGFFCGQDDKKTIAQYDYPYDTILTHCKKLSFSRKRRYLVKLIAVITDNITAYSKK